MRFSKFFFILTCFCMSAQASWQTNSPLAVQIKDDAVSAEVLIPYVRCDSKIRFQSTHLIFAFQSFNSTRSCEAFTKVYSAQVQSRVTSLMKSIEELNEKLKTDFTPSYVTDDLINDLLTKCLELGAVFDQGFEMVREALQKKQCRSKEPLAERIFAPETLPERETVEVRPAIKSSPLADVLTAKKTNKSNIVISPYPPYRELDILGLTSGTYAKDPSTGKIFKIP